MVRSSPDRARGGEGRHRGSDRGGFLRRCKEARETPRASQAATEPNPGTAWTAALMSCSVAVESRQGNPQKCRYFFLNVDDEFGAGQPLRQMAILPLQLAHFFRERIVFELGPAPLRSQAQIALLAPVREVRRVKTLAAQQGADSSRLVGRIGLGYNALLLVSGEMLPSGIDNHTRAGN